MAAAMTGGAGIMGFCARMTPFLADCPAWQMAQ